MPAQSTHIPLKPSQSPRLTGYQAYAKAGRRWGFTPQVEVEKLEHAGEDNKITAQAVTQDLAYTIPIKIGTPGVVKHLLVDTSSSQTWILLGEQKGEKSEDSNASGREARGVYDPTASSTAEKLTQSWSPPDVIHPASVIPTGLSASVNESGVLSASPPLKPQSSLPVDEKYVEIAHTAAKIKTIPPHGEVYKDKIVIGSIELEGQMFELATKERFESTLDPEVEGVLGLGLGDSYKVGDEKAGQVEVIPVLQKLMDSLEAPVFTVNLTPGGQGSFYTFGSIDKGITPNALKFTSLDESESGEDGWAFASTAWSLDGVVQRRSGTCAVADTGTTLMLLDSDMCEKIYNKIPNSKFSNTHNAYVYPTSSTLPSVAFAVGSQLYTIAPTSFVHTTFEEDGQEMAYGSFQKNGGNGKCVFGDVFFHNVYVVFDYGKRQIGTAQKNLKAVPA